MPILDFEIPPLLGKAESAGDARPNLRDVLVAHHKAIHALNIETGSRVALQSDRGDRIRGPEEVWVREWTASLDGLPPSIVCRVSGQFQGVGIFNVRIGGTWGQPDGSSVLEFTNLDDGTVQEAEGGAFPNPGGSVRVKLTGCSPYGADIYCPSIVLF